MGHRLPPPPLPLLLLLPLLLAPAVLVPAAPLVHAGEVSVSTDRGTYSYGEFLSFTVTVGDVTHDTAAFRIIDAVGVKSSTVMMRIAGTDTTLTAPAPFSPDRFEAGTYVIEVEYDGATASASFDLADSGRVVIPFWTRDVADLWVRGVIDDGGFLTNLVDNGVITADQTPADGADIRIPGWYKDTALLWMDGAITDGEFAAGLQYLVSAGAARFG